MNKKVIWLIIILTSSALFGIMYMQARWVKWNVNLNKQKFDNSVFSTLNRVANRLEILEEKRKLSELDAYLSEQKVDILKQNNGLRIGEGLPGQGKGADSFLQSAYANPPDLDERINLQELDDQLRLELENSGINIKYDYAVYSVAKNGFVIQNNHYVIPNDDNRSTDQALLKSPYKVRLFPQDLKSMGFLFISFPDKSSLLWGQLWKLLGLSVLFALLILFCFVFTVQVIFRQKRVSSMKTDFINNMTHEFKTPLATISLAADSITSERIIGDQEKVRKFADVIKQENKRMNSQVEKVLQMALIDKKEFDIKPTEVNVHELIYQAVDHARLKVNNKGGTVDTVLNASDPVIEADLTHVLNVIHNLLDNANKYTPENPKIEVGTKDGPNGVYISVKDNGVGMSKEAKKHIFDKFYRVSTGNLHDVKGFGLGLSYVKAILTAHKGQIDVKSELGKGSVFTLFFPRSIEK